MYPSEPSVLRTTGQSQSQTEFCRWSDSQRCCSRKDWLAAGMAAFELKDQMDGTAVSGRTYLARQLPNNYRGPHTKQPRGRMKPSTGEPADLFMKGMTGNDENWLRTSDCLCGVSTVTAVLPPKRSINQPIEPFTGKRTGEQRRRNRRLPIRYVLNNDKH